MLLCYRVSFSVKEDEEEEEGEGNELLVELEGKEEKRDRETSLWFSKVCVWGRACGWLGVCV